MKISKEEVIKIANISKIALKEEEIEPLVKQLEDVLSYAQCVKKVADELVDQPSNKNVNFLREDVIVRTDAQTVLGQAPEREGDFFVVPKILDNKS